MTRPAGGWIIPVLPGGGTGGEVANDSERVVTPCKGG